MEPFTPTKGSDRSGLGALSSPLSHSSSVDYSKNVTPNLLKRTYPETIPETPQHHRSPFDPLNQLTPPAPLLSSPVRPRKRRRQNIESSIITDLEQPLEQPLEDNTSSPPAEQVDSNLREPMAFFQRKQMHNSWVYKRTYGLCNSLKQECALRPQEISWNKVSKFLDEEESMAIAYLEEINPIVLDLFIRGEIPRVFHDPTLEKGIHKAIQRHNVTVVPLVYINYMSRAGVNIVDSTQNTLHNFPYQGKEWKGHGLTPSELQQVVETMAEYTSPETNLTSADLKGIDSAYIAILWKDLPEQVRRTHVYGRRYLPSDRAVRIIREWCMYVRATMIQPLKASANDIENLPPFPWSFHEVGFSVQGKVRAEKHSTHIGTNYLWGLFTAVVTYNWGGWFEINTFRFNRVLEPQHADIVETMASVATSSYWFYGGLNPALAGGSKQQGFGSLNDASNHHLWDKAKEEFVAEKTFAISRADSSQILQKRIDQKKAAVKLDKAITQANELQAQVNDKTAKLSQAKESLQNTKDSVSVPGRLSLIQTFFESHRMRKDVEGRAAAARQGLAKIIPPIPRPVELRLQPREAITDDKRARLDEVFRGLRISRLEDN